MPLNTRLEAEGHCLNLVLGAGSCVCFFEGEGRVRLFHAGSRATPANVEGFGPSSVVGFRGLQVGFRSRPELRHISLSRINF